MAKIKKGDRVQIPNDDRVYTVAVLDEGRGYALLKGVSPIRWMPIGLCQKVSPGG